jgi:type IV pilus assembly protein PilB
VADLPAPTANATRLFGDVVVDLGFASREAVERAVQLARAQGKPTGQTLVEQGVLRHDQLARVVAERYELPYIDLSLYDVDMQAARLLDPVTARSYQALPVGFLSDGQELLLAMADPANAMVVDDIAMITGKAVLQACASADELHLLISRLESQAQASATSEASGEQTSEEQASEQREVAEFFAGPSEGGPAQQPELLHVLLSEARRRGAQSIHVSHAGSDTHAVLRIDGVLSDGLALSAEQTGELLARAKELAQISEHETTGTHEGRFRLQVGGHELHVSVLALTLADGEDLFLRVSDAHRPLLGLHELGMAPTEHDRFAYAISKPSGMVLLSGPAGSGTSTTAYAALAAINDGSRRIITVEQRIETTLPGVRQMQLSPEDQVSFSGALRGVLHAEPDVVMVSDVGEREHARASLEAAISGRLVLAAIHARDAAGAISRLAEAGVEPHLIAGGVDCVVSQRLVRVLCPHCKRQSGAPDSLLAEYGLTEAYEAAGCEHCAGGGYRGRTGVYEVLPVTEEIRALVLEGAARERILTAARLNGVRSLREDAVQKARAAITSIAEVERLTIGLL